MKLALISDLHANLAATEAVFERIDALNPDAIVCMGDLVGYGPQPNEVIDLVRRRDIPCVLGNHDGAVVGSVPLRVFTEPNNTVLRWTQKNLRPDNIIWLRNLRLTMTSADLKLLHPKFSGVDENLFYMVHASPMQPDRWIYLNSTQLCRQALEIVPQTFCFVGHTHVPGVVANELGIFGLEPGYRFVINPGSVGQSRDVDRRPSFMMLDTDRYEYQLYRVEYDIEATIYAYDDIGIDEKSSRMLL